MRMAPNHDQYFGPVIFLYAVFVILPAVTVTIVLALLLVLLALIAHL